jgi:hypothetical protein
VASIIDSAFRILRETLTWGIPKPKVPAIGSLPGHAKVLQYQRIEPTAASRVSVASRRRRAAAGVYIRTNQGGRSVRCRQRVSTRKSPTQ